MNKEIKAFSVFNKAQNVLENRIVFQSFRLMLVHPFFVCKIEW